MGKADLRAVSTLLGTQDYICGTAEPIDMDCVLFGFMCMILYGSTDDCVYTDLVRTELTNLVEHTERMKRRAWPNNDWEENCLK